MGRIVKYDVSKQWCFIDDCYIYKVLSKIGSPLVSLRQKRELTFMSDEEIVELLSDMTVEYFKEPEVIGSVHIEHRTSEDHRIRGG